MPQLAARVHALFNDERLRSMLVKSRAPLTLIGCLLVLFFLEPAWLIPGIIISALGTAGQLWCFGCLKKRKVLATQGPYCLVRNPMYLARYLQILGVVLFTGNLYLALAFTVIYYFYMVNRVKREERALAPIFGQDYVEYCARVGRFLPALKHPRWRDLRCFNWEYFLENHGHRNLGGMLILYAMTISKFFLGHQ